MKKLFKNLILVLIVVFILIEILRTKSSYADIPEKTITTDNLGVHPIINPQHGNGGWNKVFYGKDEESNPLLYNVLNKDETKYSELLPGKKSLFLDCATVLGPPVNTSATIAYEWQKSLLRTKIANLCGSIMTSVEQDAVMQSTRGGVKDEDYEFGNLLKDKFFALNHIEATDPNYGFPTTQGSTDLRKKSNNSTWIATDYWLRSPSAIHLDGTAQVTANGKIIEEFGSPEGYANAKQSGMSPAFNIDKSRILFSEAVTGTPGYPNTSFKLTLIDNRANEFKTTAGKVSREGNTITVPFTLSGNSANNASQMSIMVTDKSFIKGKPFDEAGATVLKYGKLNITSGSVTSSGVGTFVLPDGCEWESKIAGDREYHVYLFAEDINEWNSTDYASELVELEVPATIFDAYSKDYEECYDGNPHGITVVASVKNAVIKYGTSADSINLDQCPTITNVIDSGLRVYYKVTAEGYEGEKTGSNVIKITKKPVKVSGITAEKREYNGALNVTLKTNNVTFDGIIDGDNLSISDASGFFRDKNVGTNKTIDITYSLTGTDIWNYEIDEVNSQTTTTAGIYKRNVKVSGITAYDKVYDGNEIAVLNFSNVIIDPKVNGDDLFITAWGEFPSREIQYNAQVNIHDLQLIGSDANNYDLAISGQQETTTASIKSPGQLPNITIEGQEYVYDGQPHTITITVKSTEPAGDPDNVLVEYNLDGGNTWFENPDSLTDVGQKTIYYHVKDKNNLVEVFGNAPLRVTPRPIKVNDNSIIVTNKVYDGKTTATIDITNATLDDAIAGDDINVSNGFGDFADKNVGENKEVVISGLTLSGDKASNYRLDTTSKSKASITKRTITISGAEVTDKIYDGTTEATVNTDNVKIDNFVDADDVTVIATGNFENANIGNNKTVNLSYTLSGVDAKNYLIDESNSQMSTKGNIVDSIPTKCIVTVDLNGGTPGPSYAESVEVDVGTKWSVLQLIDEFAIAPSGKMIDAVEINGNRFEINSTYTFTEDSNVKLLWKDILFTVKFENNFNSPNVFKTIDNVVRGSKVNIPDPAPTREGFTFEGWFEDQTCTTSFDFENTSIENNIIIYAKWVENHSEEEQDADLPNKYEFIEGAGQKYIIGKSDKLKFKANADYLLFKDGGKVYIDEKIVSFENYTSEEGSTIISFKKEFADSLNEGEHTLKVVFNNGGEAITKFTIAKAEQTETETTTLVEEPTTTTSDNPKTGDNIAIWISLLVISMIGVAVTVEFVKKN